MDRYEQGPRSLREIEEETLEEGREWTRKRLEEKLQAEANRHGGVFPPKPKKSVARARKDHGTEDCGGDGKAEGKSRKGS